MERWTVAEAAAHWGVSLGRARAILASRGIKRVTCYPADEIRAVERKQGKRTDLRIGDEGVDRSTGLGVELST